MQVRVILLASLAIVASFANVESASTQAFPARPVHIVVGYPPGGVGDILARLIGQWLSERLGQQFIVENRPGAASNIATEAVVRAPADGYTLLVVSPANAINATLYDKLNFDFLRDIAPVAGIIPRPPRDGGKSISSRPTRWLNSSRTPRPIRARSTLASAGTGTAAHVAGELFKMMAGIDMVHVPYRGAPLALTDMLGGQVQVMFDELPSSIDHVRNGHLRALGVSTPARSRPCRICRP